MKYTKNPLILLLLLSCITIIAVGGRFVFEPNNWFLVGGGDGMKHYYALSYLIRYGQNWHFDGLAYPFGEHFMFMDGHGIVAKILNWWHHHVFEVADKAVGISHLLVFSTILLAPFFLFKIFRYFGLKPNEAALAAFLVFILTPQWHRLHGHQTLAYQGFLPMMWWFLIQIGRQHRAVVWAVAYGSTALFFGWIHPYYLPLSAVFALSYAAMFPFSNKKPIFSKENNLKVVLFTLTALVPMVIFQVFMSKTDPYATERAYIAGGFFQYAATFEGFFLPNSGIYFDFLSQILKYKVQFEAANYVGFAGQVVFVGFVFQFLKKIIQKKWAKVFVFTENPTLNAFTQAAFLIFFFSIALVFQWFPVLLDKFPPLRQFRSLGRFGWIFYYIFTVFSVFQLKKWLEMLALKHKKAAIALTFLFASIWAVEGFHNLYATHDFICGFFHKNVFPNKEFQIVLKKTNKKQTDFQGIIPFPLFHVGTDKLAVENDNALNYALTASYQLHLPISAYFSARTPLKKSFELLQWYGEMPQINTKLPSEKPFLVIAAKPFEEQKHLPLFKTATKFFENDRFVLFELDFKKFEKIIKKEQRQRQQQFNLREKELFLTEEKIWADVPTKAILFENFDTKSKKKYEGFGNKHVFFDGFLPKDSIGQPLEISLWVNIDNALPSVPLLKCEIYDKNNSLIERKEVLGNLQTQVRGTWLRIPLNLTATEHRYKLYLGYYNDFTLFHCEADNFLIRPTNVNVWQQTGKKMGFSYNGWIEN